MPSLDRKLKKVSLVLLPLGAAMVLVGTLTNHWYRTSGTIPADEYNPVQNFSYQFSLLTTESCTAEECEEEPPIDEGMTLFILGLLLAVASLGVLFSGYSSKYRKAPSVFLVLCAGAAAGFTIMVVPEFISRAPGDTPGLGWSFYLFMLGVILIFVAALLTLLLPTFERRALQAMKTKRDGG